MRSNVTEKLKRMHPQLSPPFKRLLGYFHPYRKTLLAGIICLLMANIFRLVGPSVLRHVVDGLIVEISQAKLLRYAGLLLAIALALGVFLFFQRRLLVGVARDVEYRLRNDYFAHLQRLPLQFFHRHRTGDLMARATSDLAAVRNLTGQGLIAVMNAIFATVLIVPIMATVSLKLTLLAILPMPLLAVTTQILAKRVHERSREVQEYFGFVSSSVQESLAGVRVTRAYVQEEAEKEAFRQINRELVRRNLKLIRQAIIFSPLLQLFIGIGAIIIFWYGSLLIIRGTITLGQYVQATLYLGFVWGPMIGLGSVINLYQRALASMARIDGILSIKPAIDDSQANAEITEIAGAIEFRNLTFTYKDAPEPALREIDLRITPGQSVAIVGTVGSGKSTLVNLIPRLLEAPPGQVLIDGQPIQQVPLGVLRSAIGYVPQETFLFSDTLKDNVTFGTDKTTAPGLEVAMMESGLAEDLDDLPHGEETLIGERGVTLSGGQKQRTALARALIRRPRILILDDALSAVDTHTEEQILSHLRRLRQDRTTLIVSHRVSTVRHADLILVLKDGRVIEQGTHRELLVHDGMYAYLSQQQKLEEELVAVLS